MSADDLGRLVARLSSELPEVREEAAETVTDWGSAMTDFQKRLVVRLLSLLASAESSRRVRESQLNAMVDIFLPPLMTKADVAPLLEMPVEALDRQDAEYVDGFLEALAAFPAEEARTVHVRCHHSCQQFTTVVSSFTLTLTAQVAVRHRISAIQVVSARNLGHSSCQQTDEMADRCLPCVGLGRHQAGGLRD